MHERSNFGVIVVTNHVKINCSGIVLLNKLGLNIVDPFVYKYVNHVLYISKNV